MGDDEWRQAVRNTQCKDERIEEMNRKFADLSRKIEEAWGANGEK